MSSKDKILQSAGELFYRNGYLATSVDDILAQSGVSKSNFYYHYRSKEELGIAVLVQRKEDFFAVLRRTLSCPNLGPRDRMRRFLESLMESREAKVEQGGCPFGNLVAEMSDHSERFRCLLSSMFGGLSNQIAEVIEEGQQVGEFRRDVDPHDLAALIVQTTQGMHLMTKCHKTADAFARSARLLMHLISVTP